MPASYERDIDLPNLIPLWPSELADTSPTGRAAIVAKLERACRAERQRDLAGHWAYDRARHARMVATLKAESAALTAIDQPKQKEVA